MYKPELHPKGTKMVNKTKIYSDPNRHAQHWAWLRKKAQAVFRGEQWTLTIEQWFKLWDDSGQWENRGRHPHASAIFMQDPELGWHIWNVEVCDRTVKLAELARGRTNNKGGRPKKNGNKDN
jgi:hypothetical protein